MVKRYIKGAQLFDLKYIGSPADLADSVKNTIGEMILMILTGKDKFDPVLREQIQKHLVEIYEAENGLSPGTVATQQVMASVSNTARSLRLLTIASYTAWA